MQTLELLVEFESLSISERKSITGPVWLRLGNRAFPEEHWSDFPVVFTSALLGAALRLQRKSSAAKEEAWFLDGPYFVVLEQGDDPMWTVSLCELDGSRLSESNVDSVSSLAAIRTTATRLASECAARSWENADNRVLTDLLDVST
jgi:hypothetical protein